MTPRPVYLNHPGLARITVAAADEQTALAVAHRLIDRHNLTGASAPYRVPGEDGVHVCMYGDAAPLPADSQTTSE
ncbi:DUF6207 family protein [Streptomyces sp. NPDC047525]|uniref:DUF6207 family protein n=1 Tax=Streptomyces sp. NPDC047525 TaxID=3155264 RepID=UPI003408AC8D